MSEIAMRIAYKCEKCGHTHAVCEATHTMPKPPPPPTPSALDGFLLAHHGACGYLIAGVACNCGLTTARRELAALREERDTLVQQRDHWRREASDKGEECAALREQRVPVAHAVRECVSILSGAVIEGRLTVTPEVERMIGDALIAVSADAVIGEPR